MADPSTRRSPLVAVGAVVIVVGVVAALAMWIAASDRRSEAIAGFARAPVGCDTTLDFADTGEYLVFVETAGRLEQIRGDCDVAGEFDVGVDVPPVEITIVDPDGDAVELTDATESVDYADDGFVGSAEFALDISDSNDHVIRVETPGDEVFAVAVGRDPDAGVGALRIGALAVGFAGLLLGLGAIVRGTRRPVPEVDETWRPAPVGWSGDGFAPPGPPVFGEPQGPPSRSAPSSAPPPARPVPTGFSPPPAPPPPAPPAPAPPPPVSRRPDAPPPPGPPRIPGEPVWGPQSGWASDDTVPRSRPVDPGEDDAGDAGDAENAGEDRPGRRSQPPPVPPPPPW